MTLIVTPITVAQAATIMNAFITFVSFTIALSLIVLLVKFLPTTTTAIAWSSISRTLHSSVWPTVLGTDSRSGQTEGAVVSTLSRLSTVTTILVAVAGVILPLGLSDGPIVQGNFRLLKGVYIPDNSSLALSTTPNQGSYVYGRLCGTIGQEVICPGNDNPNTTTIAPSIVDIFNSTPHGPFTMKHRRFFEGDETQNCSVGFEASAETFVLRNDTFVVEGLIIDMTAEQPGIGLWNQTVPTEFSTGGTWSQDILWIEPETQCVDTNLTVDYFLENGPELDSSKAKFNITDHGGFYNLTHVPPSLNRDGQNINLREHAYKGAAYSNLFAMMFFNATRNSSSEGSTYPLSNDDRNTSLNSLDLQKISVLPLSYLNNSVASTTNTICRGFGGADTANITNVHVDCGIFLGPPLRTDGGDPRIFDGVSKWAQGIHACSSATRVSVQTVAFSSNSSTGIQGLRINRDKNGLNVLWATEKTNLNISGLDLFWGRVDDRYENDSSLWTTRSNRFFLPAGFTSILGGLGTGMPAAAHAEAWSVVYKTGFNQDSLQDYSGETDFALRTKFQNLVESDPIRGNAQIRNLIFTDVMANNIIGTQFNNTLSVAEHLKSISYDFRYAIPGFLLLAIWTPSFLLAVVVFLTRTITFRRMREVFNHTSVGRVVVGTSALRVQPQGGGAPHMPVPHHYDGANVGDGSRGGGGKLGHRRNKSDWASTVGKTLVTLNLNSPLSSMGNITEEHIKLMEPHSNHASG